MLKDPNGLPQAGTTEITLSLYASVEGVDALWRESQIVEVDEQGHYAVFLGGRPRTGCGLFFLCTGLIGFANPHEVPGMLGRSTSLAAQRLPVRINGDLT